MRAGVPSEFARYLLANVPGWFLAAGIAWAAVRWLGLATWIALAVLAAWIVKDIVLFPFMRRFYESEPATKRMLGEKGIAISAIDPDGFVQVRGEIWQAHRVDRANPIVKGAPVRVRNVDGLRLLVEAVHD